MIEVGNAIMEWQHWRIGEASGRSSQRPGKKDQKVDFWGDGKERGVQNWAEKSLVMLEIFRCI
jgi:hypothetical protein